MILVFLILHVCGSVEPVEQLFAGSGATWSGQSASDAKKAARPATRLESKASGLVCLQLSVLFDFVPAHYSTLVRAFSLRHVVTRLHEVHLVQIAAMSLGPTANVATFGARHLRRV